jgi:two-component system cell cycle response regulator/two-component system cell cycle response regulator DivK
MNTILLVEDNTNNASLVEDIFSFDGVPARLVAVQNAEEALYLAATLQPVLVLMDLRLPGIDGLEATQLLKSNPKTRDIPVWALTAYAMPGDREKAIEAGCSEYFSKPLSMKHFGDGLRNFLKQLEEPVSREYSAAAQGMEVH